MIARPVRTYPDRRIGVLTAPGSYARIHPGIMLYSPLSYLTKYAATGMMPRVQGALTPRYRYPFYDV